MSRSFGRRVAAAAVVVFAIAGGIAWASIPSANGTYTACRHKTTGAVRLIDKSLQQNSPLARCTPAEEEVTWSQTGPPGPPGSAGAKGDKGDKGDPGGVAASAQQVVSHDVSVADNFQLTWHEPCPAGTIVTGGGFDTFADPNQGAEKITSLASRPDGFGQGWQVTVLNHTGHAITMRVWAICLAAS